MLDEIGSKDNVPPTSRRSRKAKAGSWLGHASTRTTIPGQDHQVGRHQVFEVTGRNTKLEIALELERIALEDDYFVQRKLYPNVDFYSGIMLPGNGLQAEMFTVLFAIPRTIGWLAQWQEMLNDPSRRSRVHARCGSATKRGSSPRSRSGSRS